MEKNYSFLWRRNLSRNFFVCDIVLILVPKNVANKRQIRAQFYLKIAVFLGLKKPLKICSLHKCLKLIHRYCDN